MQSGNEDSTQPLLSGEVSPTSETTYFVPFEEPPTQIARIIGIIAMVMGALSIVGGLMNIGTGQVMSFFSNEMSRMDVELVPTWFYSVSGVIGIVGGIGFLYGGYRMQKFEMIGQWITLGTLAVVTILQVSMAVLMPEEIFTGGQDLSEFGISNETIIMIGKLSTVGGAVCQGGFCGAVFALPLLVGNHGLR